VEPNKEAARHQAFLKAFLKKLIAVSDGADEADAGEDEIEPAVLAQEKGEGGEGKEQDKPEAEEDTGPFWEVEGKQKDGGKKEEEGQAAQKGPGKDFQRQKGYRVLFSGPESSFYGEGDGFFEPVGCENKGRPSEHARDQEKDEADEDAYLDRKSAEDALLEQCGDGSYGGGEGVPGEGLVLEEVDESEGYLQDNEKTQENKYGTASDQRPGPSCEMEVAYGFHMQSVYQMASRAVICKKRAVKTLSLIHPQSQCLFGRGNDLRGFDGRVSYQGVVLVLLDRFLLQERVGDFL
jgi:hypothetical protein